MDKTEISMMEIAQSKIFADEAKYFSLFEKHIPVLDETKKVLIYAIDNLGCICRMIEKNPDAKYTVYGNACINDCVKNFYPEINTIDSDPGNLKEYNIDMKFDCIIMNPPYDRGLHLKILSEVTKHIYENGIITSLQPIVKWQESKLFHQPSPIPTMNVSSRISMDEASSLFNINQRCELGILTNRETNIEIVDNYEFLDKLYSKLSIICNDTLKSHLEVKDKTFPIAFGDGCSIAGNGGHGCACYRITGYNEDKACRNGEIGHVKRYNATSKKEQHQIWKFYQNPIMRFIYKEFGFGGIPYSIIPFITSFKDINNKTPLDYEWTCFDLCKYFEISSDEFKNIIFKTIQNYLYDDEKKIIEDTMAKYVK